MVSMMTLRATTASSSNNSNHSARMTTRTSLLPFIVACTSIVLASTLTAVLVDGFVPIPNHQRTTTRRRTYNNNNNGSVRINVIGQQRRRQPRRYASSTTTTMVQTQSQRLTNIEMPLLDLSPEFYQQMIQPLPSSHLQSNELTTLNIYGMEITRPSHNMVVNDAMERNYPDNVQQQQFGHIAYKPNPDNLIGAIGCAAEIMVRADSGDSAEGDGREEGQSDTETTNTVVLCRGTFRFVVRDVIKTIPFPVAIVDELVDDADINDASTIQTATTTVEEEDIDDDDGEEDDDDDYDYDELSPSELIQRTLASMKQYAELKLEDARAKANEEISPLEQSIIEDMKPSDNDDGESSSTLQLGMGDDRQAQLHAAEEMYAVYDVFQSSLVDLAFSKTDQYYAVAFMACEMASMSNDIRRQCLQTTNGIHRLRLVLKQLDELIGMTQARKLADTITTKTDESEKELQVGQPTLPPWSKRIVKGTKIEYYWNEEYGWSSGQVIEEPLTVVDEIILTVQFDSDMSVYKLPFTAEDKVRWRPSS